MKKIALAAGLAAGLLSVLVDPALGQDCRPYAISGTGSASPYEVMTDVGGQWVVRSRHSREATAIDAARDSLYGRPDGTFLVRSTFEMRWRTPSGSTCTPGGSGPPPPAPPPAPPPSPPPAPPPPPSPGADTAYVVDCDAASCTVEARWTASEPWEIVTVRPSPRLSFPGVQPPYTFTVPRGASDVTAAVAVQRWSAPTGVAGRQYIDPDLALGTVTIPAAAGGPAPPPPPPPGPPPPPSPPPPPAGQHFVANLSACTNDASLYGMLNVVTQGNVHCEPGVGMRYDFQPFPARCNDQALTSHVALPAGTQEVWFRYQGRFSVNWDTRNPNCSSPAPAYKWVLTDLQNSSRCGISRFDWVAGLNGENWATGAPGAPQCDNVPITVVQPGNFGSSNPYRMSALADGQWHTVEIHYKIETNPERATVQARVDGVVIANYTTSFSGTVGYAGNAIRRIRLGANRNLGATELMHVWWDDVEVWVGNQDPGFGFPSPTVYP